MRTSVPTVVGGGPPPPHPGLPPGELSPFVRFCLRSVVARWPLRPGYATVHDPRQGKDRFRRRSTRVSTSPGMTPVVSGARRRRHA